MKEYQPSSITASDSLSSLELATDAVLLLLIAIWLSETNEWDLEMPSSIVSHWRALLKASSALWTKRAHS